MTECQHETLELVEDDKEDDLIWARCADCFVLFKFTHKEWQEQFEETKKDVKV